MLHIKDTIVGGGYWSPFNEDGSTIINEREEALKILMTVSSEDNGARKNIHKTREQLFYGRVCAGTVTCLWTLALYATSTKWDDHSVHNCSTIKRESPGSGYTCISWGHLQRVNQEISMYL